MPFECLDDRESKSGTHIHILWINISNLDETVEEFATENDWWIIHDKNLNIFIEAINFQIKDTKYANLMVNWLPLMNVNTKQGICEPMKAENLKNWIALIWT